MSQGKTTRIDILRHGLPEGDGCLRGSTDFTITDVGLEQMSQSVSGLDDIEQVVTSPLHRCQYFASTFAARYALPIQNDPQWQELDFGEWDGQDKHVLWQEHGEQLTRFWENPWQFTPHGGESLVEFDRRIQQAWQSLIDTYNGKRILLVTHSGVMKQLLRQLLLMPEDATYLQRIDLPYAARYRVTVYTDESGNGKHWPQLNLF